MRRRGKFGRDSARLGAALFLVLIFAGFTFLQAVHIHGEADHADAAHCALCAAAHAPAILTLPALLPSLTAAQVQVVLPDPLAGYRTRLTALYSRPPPPIA
jgi:hypothetical protein